MKLDMDSSSVELSKEIMELRLMIHKFNSTSKAPKPAATTCDPLTLAFIKLETQHAQLIGCQQESEQLMKELRAEHNQMTSLAESIKEHRSKVTKSRQSPDPNGTPTKRGRYDKD